MPEVRIASFNVFGIEGRDIAASVTQAAARMGPSQASARAIGFQEVFYQHQLAHIRNAWLGAGVFASTRSKVIVAQSQSPGSWACLSPDTPALIVPGFDFDNSSGLALCVRGRLSDCFFDRFRVGYAPDRIAHKGLLAALVVDDGVRRAFVTTHLNNSSNDRLGYARAWQIEQIANDLRWIDRHWRAPVTLLGDFNIDAIRALVAAASLDRILYARLLAAGRAPGTFFWDVNARERLPNPATPTSMQHPTAIDMHLLDRTDGRTGLSFSTHDAGGDHFLTESVWVEP